MNRHFTSTRFIQYSYFNAIPKLAPAIYQNDIYILYKCIIPNDIVGYIVLYILNTTIIAHRYIMQGRMIQSGMFTHTTCQRKLIFKDLAPGCQGLPQAGHVLDALHSGGQGPAAVQIAAQA